MVKQVSVHNTVGKAGKAGVFIRKMGKGGLKRPEGGWLHHANREYRQVKQEGGVQGENTKECSRETRKGEA